MVLRVCLGLYVELMEKMHLQACMGVQYLVEMKMSVMCGGVHLAWKVVTDLLAVIVEDADCLQCWQVVGKGMVE